MAQLRIVLLRWAKMRLIPLQLTAYAQPIIVENAKTRSHSENIASSARFFGRKEEIITDSTRASMGTVPDCFNGPTTSA
jgi:hypothetical protein